MVLDLLHSLQKTAHVVASIPKEVDKQKAKLFDGSKVSLEWCNFVILGMVNLKLLGCLAIVALRSGLRWLGRLYSRGLQHIFYFLFLIGASEKFLYGEAVIGWGLGDVGAIHAFWGVEQFFRVDLAFDFVLNVYVFGERFILRRLQLANRKWSLLYNNRLIVFFVLFLQDIFYQLFNVNFVIGQIVFFGLGTISEPFSLHCFIKVLYRYQRALN